MRGRDLAWTVALMVGSIGAYHLLVPRPAAGSRRNEEALEGVAERQTALEARLSHLEARVGKGPRDPSLEARVGRLEARGDEAASSGPDDRTASPRWTDVDLEAFREMSEELDRRKRGAAERQQVAALLDRTAPDLPADGRERMIDRLVLHLRETKAAQAQLAAAKTAEEREAADRRTDALRAQLAQDVERDFPGLEKTLPWIQPPRPAGR